MMVHRFRTPAALAAFALVCALAAQDISYAVRVNDPASGVLHVSMTVATPGAGPLDVRIPAWCPGWYVLTQYHEKISNVRAVSGTGTVAVSSPEQRLWRIEKPDPGPLTILYDVRADDRGFGFFYAHLDAEHGFINPPSTFFYIEGRKNEPVEVRFELPAGWRVATALDSAGPSRFAAADYDELVDSPFELGHFTRVDFEAGGVPMFATFTHRGDLREDPDEVVKGLKKVAEAQIRMFGSAPMKRYFWNIHMGVGSFGGGLEHRASTTLNVGSAGDLGFLGLASHEFFHLWNVKRIRPKLLGPFDYTKEQRTKNLWFAEGVTSYYGEVALYRAGLIDRDDFLGDILNEINSLARSSDRKRYTVEEASLRAWEGGSQGYGNLSYYNKGYLIGLLLDLAIRTRTQGEKSLDDVMRHLMAKHNPQRPGYDEDGILTAINEVTKLDFTELYDKTVRTTDELPYAQVLGAAGLSSSSGEAVPDPGFRVDLPGERAYPRVARLDASGPGVEMGLQPGDVILKVDGADVRGNADPMGGVEGGAAFTLEVMRRGNRIEMTGTMRLRAGGPARLALAEDRTPLQEKVLMGWLAR